jgi:signal peptidase I
VSAPEEVYAPGPPEDEDAGPPPPTGPTKRKRSTTRSIVEWVAVVGGALVVALVIRAFFLAAFYIPSESMVPTLQKGDRVLVNKLSYKLHDVHRGDVVVFGRPPGEQDNGIKDLIKRVVGLPGETVEVRDCKVLINGRALDEPYVKTWNRTCTFAAHQVGANQVFVMGDNRDDSQDSRFFGPISEDLIVGRAFVIVWPLTHLGWL